MRIAYLGPLEVRNASGGLVDVPGRRLRTLLGRLALEVGRPVSSRLLVDALWADDAPGDPVNALQSLVSRLRRTLGDAGLVAAFAGGYRLDVAPDDVDGHRFARLAAAGHRRFADGGPGAAEAAAEILTEALHLWRGDPLPDDDSVEADAARTRLGDLRLQVLADRVEADLAVGRAAEVVGELEQLVQDHPLREDLAGLRMRALVAVGRPAEALAAYETTRAYLADTLGSDPSRSLQDQHLAVLRMQDQGPSRRTNLRSAVTSFVGRDEATRRVEALLDDGRLVTIVGTGGAGKTRLASEVAASWVSRMRDGVWFAELAPVSDPSNLALAVLDGLGIRDVGSIDQRAERVPHEARERVLQTLSDAECVVVIDNCEHVIETAAALVADILGQCPGVRVIATSREPLAIDGEALFALTPLAVPDDGDAPDVVARAPAVRLLLDRARSVGADLVVDARTVADVVEVVRRLDGLPLAVELAAARLRVLSIGEVASRLADRFRLLTGGRRTAMPRHRTLRAVVEWSWDLLPPLEREVADHFAVFGSGATAEAVAAVCPAYQPVAGSPSATGIDLAEVGDVLHALVDKSLLVVEHRDGHVRYRMLETLREFGAEQLAERGVIDQARARHAHYYAELVREADAGLRTDRQVQSLQRFDAERDNALTALAYLGEHDHPQAALEMAVNLSWFWMLRENGKDSSRWLQFAMGVPGAAASELYIVAEALNMVTSMAANSSTDAPSDRGLLELAERLEVAQSLHQIVPVLRPLLLFFAEEREAARRLVSQALTNEDPWVRVTARTIRMAFAENDGDIDTIRADVDLGVKEWERVGDHWGMAAMLASRGQVRTIDGDVDGASADFEEALAHLRVIGGGADDMMMNMRLADLRLRAGDLEGAQRYADSVRGDSRHGELGMSRDQLADITLGVVAAQRGDAVALAEAESRLRDSLAGGDAPSPFQAHASSLSHAFLGSMAAVRGDLDAAWGHVQVAYQMGRSTKDLPILANVGVSVATYARARGLDREAAVVLGASARLRGSPDLTDVSVAGLTAALRLQSAVGGFDFDAAYAEGLALDRDAAIARVDPAQLDPVVPEPALLDPARLELEPVLLGPPEQGRAEGAR